MDILNFTCGIASFVIILTKRTITVSSLLVTHIISSLGPGVEAIPKPARRLVQQSILKELPYY